MMHIHVQGQAVFVESLQFTARLEGGLLVSLLDRETGVEFCRPAASAFPLDFVYMNGESVGAEPGAPLPEGTEEETQPPTRNVTVKSLSASAARVVYAGNNTDRELFVRLDPETGDLCVRPSGQTARRGLMAIRWNIPFARKAKLVLPTRNGIEVTADRDVLPPLRCEWPSHWNAQLAIAEVGQAAAMVHCEDTAYKYKALNLQREEGLSTLGFESEQIAPLTDNRTAGGVEWRINTYRGGWHAAADRYRAWMESAYQLAKKRAQRPDWTQKISLAVCWATTNPQLLDGLAKLYPPDETLIHLDHWRANPYDIHYPAYEPMAATRAFIEKANAMGFKVIPHFNYFACCKGHPLYAAIQDWHVRDLARNEPQGWFFPIGWEAMDEQMEADRVRNEALHGVPPREPEKPPFFRLAYIHPGLARWRRELEDHLVAACDGLQAPGAFLDQTYHTWNCNPGVVENMTMVEGLHLLQEELAAIRPDLVLAGECLTEVSFQRQTFAQTHPWGWGNMQQVHVEAAHPICSYLWSGHTRLIGYIELEPWNPRLDVSIAIHSKMGVLPTLVARERTAAEPGILRDDHPGMKQILDWARRERKQTKQQEKETS